MRIEWTIDIDNPITLEIPLSRKEPTAYVVKSMPDLSHESVSDEQLDQIFAVMALTPQHTYQVLTKNLERVLKYYDSLTARNGGIRFAGEIARTGCEMEPQRKRYYSLINSLRHDGASCLPLPNVHLGAE